MRIRNFIVIILLVIICFLVYLLACNLVKNVSLKKMYNEVQEIVKQNEIDKEDYINKEKELEQLKEKNKNKILKYEKVEKWNQEIKGYLD